MSLTEVDLKQQFSDYVVQHHFQELLDIMGEPDQDQHYSMIVDSFKLVEENAELINALLSAPEKTLPIFDSGLVAAQKNVLENVICGTQETYSLKIKVHARITGFPSTVELSKTTFPRNEQLGIFLKVSGIVVKVTLPKLLEHAREYRCKKCGNAQTVTADFELCHALVPPKSCPNLCNPAIFVPVKTEGGGILYKDYQELKVQEEMGKLQIGTIPSSMWVTVDDDLVDVCHPGDHVTIWGTVMRRWKGLSVGGCGDVELVIKANNLQVTNHQKTGQLVNEEVRSRCRDFWLKYKHRPLVARDLILASFCPDVYGLYLVKLAMCVVLCGGVPCADEGGGSARAESHLLLVGDPGTGKSHLLRFASRTAARSVLTTGVGSTSAGLTVSAVREGSDWQLEAGALVLADGGVCCIDELNSIREQDRTSIHEAMEQQTISVAKAGMVTKLNTRCSILAATNPKGAYDPSESLSVNVALASPLLSRFDLVLVLQDTRSQDWDRLLSSFILNLAPDSFQPSTELWSIETLQSYFALAKTFSPKMTPGANAVLTRYYQAQRGADARNVARTTVRMLESIVRLSQGHARLMLRDEVTVVDAVVAVTLVECSMAASALISAANALHASFPVDPHKQYRRQAELVLEKLHLEDLLQQEIARLDQMELERRAEDAATKNDPPEVPPCQERAPDMNNLFSQRINDILTGIRKKKDKDICEAASLTGKRKRGPVTTQKRKIRQIVEDDDDAEDVAAGDAPERQTDIQEVEEDGRRKRGRVLGDIQEADEDNSVNSEASKNCDEQAKKNSPKKNLNVDVCLDSIRGKRSEPEQRKKLKTTLEKLQMFKKPAGGNQGKDGEEFDPSPVTSSTPLKNPSAGPGVTPIKPAESQDSGKGDSESQNSNVIVSKLGSTDSSLNLTPTVPPDGASGTCELTSQISLNSEYVITSTPFEKVVDCRDSQHRRDTLLVPTPLITPHNRPKGYDRQKLMALARLGKKLSQTRWENSQSSQVNSTQNSQKAPSENCPESPSEKCEKSPPENSQGNALEAAQNGKIDASADKCSQVAPQSSQFSLHEMSWDDLELEL